MSPTLATTAALLICFAAHLRAEETADSYYHRGNANYQRGNFSAAIADYTRAIEANPKYNKAYYERGVARDAEGDRDGAIADYTRAIELDPKYADAYSQRADAWEKMKQYDSAIKDIQKAIELEPKKGDYYLDLAWYELFDRNPREAIAASLKALRLSPAKAMIKTNLAHGYLFDNQFDKTKAIYLENKDAKLRDDERTVSQAVLDDFKELEEAGITHPDMEKIKALLKIRYPSPDGRFALRITESNQAELIENASGRLMVDLGVPWRSQVLVWSPDSKRVAYGNRGDKAGEVSVYFWDGSTFEEATLPDDLPSPDIKFRKEHESGHVKNYGGAVTPLRWLKSGELELSSDAMMLHSNSGATSTGELRFTLAFDARHHASVKKVGKTKTEVDE